VFTIAYQKRDTFQLGTNFGGWLRTIARNVVLQHCRKRARQPLFDHDEAIEQLDRVAAESEEHASDPFFLERRKQFLKACLDTITQRVQKLLQLRYAEGQPAEAIAKLLGMNVSAVNVAAFRAKIALAHCVEAKEQAEGA
jgi:RNA polymerase sigma-70 factor (ECF subfamily)